MTGTCLINAASTGHQVEASTQVTGKPTYQDLHSKDKARRDKFLCDPFDQEAALMRFLCGLCLLFLMATVAASKQENQKKEDKTDAQAQIVSRIAVKGDVMKKKLVHKVTPRYPAEAMRQRVSGTVVLRVVIGVDGAVKDMQYVSGPRTLVQATMDGVRQYKYQPTMLNGQPVEVDTTVETVFEVRQ